MTRYILVGVDGSPNADRALAWAVTEAGLRQCVVRAMNVWTYPYVGDIGYVPGARMLDAHELETEAKATLAHAVAKLPEGGPTIEPVVVEGRPAHRLLEEAEGAELLVLGSRGHGGFVGAVLGSVSHRCVSHAPCPVVVIPQPA